MPLSKAVRMKGFSGSSSGNTKMSTGMPISAKCAGISSTISLPVALFAMTRMSASLPGTALPSAREPNRTTFSARPDATRSRARSCNTPLTCSVSSENTLTEPYDSSRTADRGICILRLHIVSGHPFRKPVGIPGLDVPPVK